MNMEGICGNGFGTNRVRENQRRSGCEAPSAYHRLLLGWMESVSAPFVTHGLDGSRRWTHEDDALLLAQLCKL
jgi:hypothetical protein